MNKKYLIILTFFLLIFSLGKIFSQEQQEEQPFSFLTEANLEQIISDESAALTIRTDIPRAEIFINGIYKGLSPLCIKSLLPGFYKITIKKQGYEEIKKIVRAENGKDRTFEFNLNCTYKSNSLEYE